MGKAISISMIALSIVLSDSLYLYGFLNAIIGISSSEKIILSLSAFWILLEISLKIINYPRRQFVFLSSGLIACLLPYPLHVAYMVSSESYTIEPERFEVEYLSVVVCFVIFSILGKKLKREK